MWCRLHLSSSDLFLFGLALTNILTEVSGSNADFYLKRLKRQATCKQSEFKCASGECISSYNVCDGSKDCSDASDEQASTCKQLNIRCPPQALQCSYGACIDKELRCDGKSDCADESDELGCSLPSYASSCASGSFNCSNGQCVNQYSVCDGAKDCSDGSDETRKVCQGLKCPSRSFQCDYGACLDLSVRCDGSPDCPDSSDEAGCPDTSQTPPDDNSGVPAAGGCRLPQHPQYGVYLSYQCSAGDVRAACRNTPGTPVPRTWLLKYSCNQGYELSSAYEYAVCDNGLWNNALDCIKLCPPLESLSVDLRCELEGREVPCERPTKPGTSATAQCKQHYQQTFKPEYSRLTCLSGGQWNYHLFYCTPVCGLSLKSDTLNPLILDGLDTKKGEFPWLVALYLRKTSTDAQEWDQQCGGTLISPHLVLTGIPSELGEFPWLTAVYLKDEGGRWDQQCAGTLISPHIVLTAAHCLVTEAGTLKPEDVKVGLGKYYRNFYKNESFSIIADVREIVIPRYYVGRASFYALDIALLDLTVSVQVKGHIMPACVDWTSSLMLYPDNVGHVAGWGSTENGTSSEVVLSAHLPYIDNAACIVRVRPAFQRLITHDKFCAQSSNGSQVDKGDSGGGLTAVRGGQHFVIGVVSTKLSGENAYSLFTNVSNAEHLNWLNQQRTRLDALHRET